MHKNRLGEILLSQGVLSKSRLEFALKVQKSSGQRLGEILCKMLFCSEEEVIKALAEQNQMEYYEPKRVSEIDIEKVKKVGYHFCKDNGCLPLKDTIIIDDPVNTIVTDKIEREFPGITIKVAMPRKIYDFLEMLQWERTMSDIVSQTSDDIERFVNYVISRAIVENVSDIHISATNKIGRIQYRIDGILQDVMTFQGEKFENIANLIFTRAGVRKHSFIEFQNASFEFTFANRNVDIRFASGPDYSTGMPFITMRIIQNMEFRRLEKMGFPENTLQKIYSIIRRPYGIVVISGPTGSGKTTTLHAILDKLNDNTRNILTIEDPPEILVPTIKQVAVNEKKGVNFSEAIRQFLRHDPDVILVGETRDPETAREVFRAANTGHLVFTTVHANTAVEAISRFLDLEVEPYKFDSLIAVMAQRLLRKLCDKCKKKIDTKEFLSVEQNKRKYGKYIKTTDSIFEANPSGCEKCIGGYSGRTVVAEIVFIDNNIKEMIREGKSSYHILEYLQKNYHADLTKNAMNLVTEGVVSIEEVERVVGIAHDSIFEIY